MGRKGEERRVKTERELDGEGAGQEVREVRG